jgi:peptide/nickel transport system permease protein
MFRYLLRRLVGIAALLVVISFITYLMFYALPVNPAALTCGKACTPDVIAANERRLGLDKPLVVQYGQFVEGIFVGRTYGEGSAVIDCPTPCLGYSFKEERPVLEMMIERFPVTFSMAIGAFVLWMVVGIGIGIVSALRRGSLLDRGLMFMALAGVSLPSFFTGLIILTYVCITWQIMPVPAYVPFSDNPGSWAKNLILPWITLAILFAALYTRLTRASMIETMGEDYIRTARAKGLNERTVIFKHGLRAALTPIITIAGLDLGGLLGGAVITESVYNFQGLGRLAISAATDFDLPVLVGVTVVAAFFIVVLNLIVDLLYAMVDPKVHLS